MDYSLTEEDLKYHEQVFGAGLTVSDEYYSSFMNEVASCDDADLMLRFLRSVPMYTTDSCVLREAYLIQLLRCEALECLQTLLSNKTEFKIHLDAPFASGEFPIHFAASSLQFHLVKFLVQHGALTCVETLGPQPIPGLPFPFRRTREDRVAGLLPLNMALHTACSHVLLESWSHHQHSAFKLIFSLCFPEIKIILDTIRLLAQNTDKLLFGEILNYLCEGKLIHVALLLMVAHPIVASTILEHEYGSHASGIDYLSGCIANQAQELSSNASLLLQVFRKVGPDLYQYVQVDHSQVPHMKIIEDVKALLLRESFVLSEEDTDFSNLESYIKTDDLATQDQNLDHKSWCASKPYLSLDSEESRHQQFRYHDLFMSRRRAPFSLDDISRKRTYKMVCPTTRDFSTCQIGYGVVPATRSFFSRKFSTDVGTTRDFSTCQIGHGVVPATRSFFSRKFSTDVGLMVKKVIRRI